MEVRNIETLTPNPNNDHALTDEGKRLLLHAMSLGDYGTFLITPEGMIINGNNRYYMRTEAGWDNKEMQCRILTAGHDETLGYYAIIDGVTILDHEVIPHYYVSVEAMHRAYAFSANGEAATYSKGIINRFDEWGLDPTMFQTNFFPPKSAQDSIDAMVAHAKKKKYEIVVSCQDEADMDGKYQQIIQLGYQAKRKI